MRGRSGERRLRALARLAQNEENPAAPAVKRESEEDWGGGKWR